MSELILDGTNGEKITVENFCGMTIKDGEELYKVGELKGNIYGDTEEENKLIEDLKVNKISYSPSEFEKEIKEYEKNRTENRDQFIKSLTKLFIDNIKEIKIHFSTVSKSAYFVELNMKNGEFQQLDPKKVEIYCNETSQTDSEGVYAIDYINCSECRTVIKKEDIIKGQFTKPNVYVCKNCSEKGD